MFTKMKKKIPQQRRCVWVKRGKKKKNKWMKTRKEGKRNEEKEDKKSGKMRKGVIKMLKGYFIGPIITSSYVSISDPPNHPT